MPESDNVLWNVIFAEMATDRHVDALAHMRELDRRLHVRDNVAHKKHARFVQMWDEAFAATGHIQVKAPAHARLSLDQRELQQEAPFPDPLDVKPGEHRLVATWSDKSKSEKVTVSAGQTVNVTFEDAPSPPAAATTLPVSSAQPPPSAPVSSNDPRAAKGDSSSSTGRTVTLVALGSGAVMALGVGIGFLVSANGHGNDAESLQSLLAPGACAKTSGGPCGELQNAIDKQNSQLSISTGAFIVSGALAAGTLATFFLWKDSKTARAWITPATGPRFGGVTIGGRF
jgi:hypothetical protein